MSLTIRTENSLENRGTLYGKQAIEAYAKFAHGSDMAYFLDPFISTDIEKNRGHLLDAGCGAAPWSIYAANTGTSHIDAIDLQPEMIKKANEAIKEAQVENKVTAAVGDATNLTFTERVFDHAISINVGCNLPESIFKKHFEEVARVLKTNGTATVAAPDSLDVVFTNGANQSDVQKHIEEVLNELPDNPEPAQIQGKLNELEEIVSATFTVSESEKRLELVKDKNNLKLGQKIWRKLAHVTIPNFYHSEKEYLDAFKESHLAVKISRKTFTSSKERISFNSNSNVHPKLGESYESHSPFVVYHLKKDDSSLSKRRLRHSCVLL